MGKVVQLLLGMAGNRPHVERAHPDGSFSNGLKNTTRRAAQSIGDLVFDQPVESKLQRSPSNKKSSGTPMKMLIAQEMSKERESKRKPPSVVARLMGLDSLPAQKEVSTVQKNLPEGFKRNAPVKQGSGARHQLQESSFQDKGHISGPYFLEQAGYKDMNEIWLQSAKSSFFKDQPPQKGKYGDNANERKMALVRQKFIEAKHLATDERLRQTKEFQDALEVLSSNRDLFLKFLQESNSLFSKHLYELQAVPPPQTKRITILKPAKTLETDRCAGLEANSEKNGKKQQSFQLDDWDDSRSGWDSDVAHHKVDNFSQPKRIVVLKPSPGKAHDVKTVASSLDLSPRLQRNKDFYEGYGTDVSKRSREIAKEITRHMQESVNVDRRDETLLPFVSSGGYMRHESHRSEIDYMEGENVSDSEIMTPISRLSWDYSKYDSPYSTSSLSRTSYTSESSVTREARKRLSERWAMMTSSGGSQEQRQVRRTSSTLGEMLALPNSKGPVKFEEESNEEGSFVSSNGWCAEEQNLKGQKTHSPNPGEHSSRSLSRSRSVPNSSLVYEKVGLSVETSDLKVSKSIDTQETAKPKSGKSIFKGNVSSLFFSRNKKSNNEKSGPSASDSSLAGSLLSSASAETNPDVKQLSSVLSGSSYLERGSDCIEGGASCGTTTTVTRLSNQQTHAAEGSSTPKLNENSSDKLDQQSPISVLEVQFEDDVSTSQSSEFVMGYQRELHARLCHEPELTTSSPVESVTRILSWDESASAELSSAFVHESSNLYSKTTAKVEEHWLTFVQALLLAAGLNHETPKTLFSRCYSTESPLDPSLLEKCMHQKEDLKQLNEAKRRQQRSDYRLMFDCVNAALVDIVKCGLDVIPVASASCKWIEPESQVPDEVWVRVRKWFFAQSELSPSEMEAGLIVEREVKKEAIGRRWVEKIGQEIDGIVKEIEGKTLEEVVEETLFDFTFGLL